MTYLQPLPGIHLLLQPAERNRSYVEMTYASGGSWFESAGDRGKRHLLEHCLVSRTKNMDFGQLKDYSFEQNIDLNAYTSNLPMSLVSAGHKDDLNKILDLMLELFLSPTFDQTDLRREKEIVLREISERRGDPGYVLYYDTLDQVFTPESLDVHQVLGSIADVAKTSLDDFQRIHQQILTESHLIFKVSGGGFTTDSVQTKVVDFINSLENKHLLTDEKVKHPIGDLPKNEFAEFTNLAYVHPLGHQHAEVTVYIPCQTSFDSRSAQAVFEQLYLKYGGILYDRLRDELGLVYGISGTFRQTMQALEIDLSCEIRHIKQILEEIQKTFGDFASNFKPQKFVQMKSKVKKQKDMTADSPKFLVDFVEKRMLNFGVAEKYEDYSDKIEKVSQEDIQGLYQEIQSNLSRKKVAVVSKNSRIETEDVFV